MHQQGTAAHMSAAAASHCLFIAEHDAYLSLSIQADYTGNKQIIGKGHKE
ncbi:hypothetical protein DAPPUDRAFT_233088 [Daphnia pulex]|uniref:Uncharacterized protein n=1 Tax=Daphnia pulex TaxID=6669 RepID=E9FT58_DAPPU|nr:hypothetical protein DAPPUDRAFT_233088 [Daphnia pulex]|eukprot:EFX89316.1 hypothetical protein DAPPUDRAFT_233088 [Daphnia pulex]